MPVGIKMTGPWPYFGFVKVVGPNLYPMKKVYLHFPGKIALTFFVVITLTSQSFSQKFENINAQALGGQIIIEYDLKSIHEKDRYEVSVYSSHNSFSTPLALVQGDVGRNVTPGKRKIVWEAKNELRNFNGQLTFEIRGRLVAGVLLIDPLQARRGKQSNITWKGGVVGDPLKIELLDKDGKVLAPLTASSPNNGKFSWAVPSDTKKGDYRIQITQNGEKSFSDVKIKSKIPLALKVLPLVVVGGLIPFLLPKPVEEDLPVPPGGPQG